MRRVVGAILAALVAALWFSLTATHGLELRDEGHILLRSQRVLEKSLPNRDFADVYGPGVSIVADSPLAAARGRAGAAPAEGAAAAGGGRGGRGGRGGAAAAGGATPPAGRGGGLQVEGLPIVKPPYGVLSAIDLDKGELKFQVPHGDTPDAVRNAPSLAGINIPKTGQNGSVGLMVTKTLVVLGDPQVTAPPGRPRGAMLRAYDKNNGAEVGAVWLPAAQSGSPMTYMADGKQYMVVAVSGGVYSGEYIAFALPNAGRATSLGQR
jgi:quinoprotein glucose dehydrogenase